MSAACVQRRVDAAVLESTPFRACVNRLRCVPRADLATDCALRCYWEAVGGGHYPSEMDASALLRVFEDAFKAEADGGCKQVKR